MNGSLNGESMIAKLKPQGIDRKYLYTENFCTHRPSLLLYEEETLGSKLTSCVVLGETKMQMRDLQRYRREYHQLEGKSDAR